jgi:ABC-type molybdate transport system ATPase subunit
VIDFVNEYVSPALKLLPEPLAAVFQSTKVCCDHVKVFGEIAVGVLSISEAVDPVPPLAAKVIVLDGAFPSFHWAKSVVGAMKGNIAPLA